jgi:uncharacterized membrane protein YuzA (DUF378 family)
MQKFIHYVALLLVVVGAVNWGLVGLFQFDLVATLFGGSDAIAARIVYSLVGLAGIVLAATSLSFASNPGLARQQSYAR